MFDLNKIVVYLAKRFGFMDGRVWFGAANAINVKLTGSERRNFLRFQARSR